MPDTPAASTHAVRHPPEIAPGAIIATFRIEALIGRGGMGAVYRARDTVLGRTVALKLLSPTLAERPNARVRFQQEAKNASWVSHDNVVQIFSFGIDAGMPYIAMEYLRGETLAERLQRGAMPVEVAVDIALPLCSGVHAAHVKDILHRDLKPGNVFLAQRPTGEVPKLLDFGISKLQGGTTAGEDQQDLTADDVVVGTELYMAPERAYKQPVDGRSDQYSLGVILYQCVTGRHPHEGKSRFRLFEDARLGRYPPPSMLIPGLPGDFEAIIMRAMSPRPADRFTSMRELGRALLPFASTRARGQWTEHYEAPDLRVTTTGSIKPSDVHTGARDKADALVAGAPSAPPRTGPTQFEGARAAGSSDRAEQFPVANAQAPTVAAKTLALAIVERGAGSELPETRTHISELPLPREVTAISTAPLSTTRLHSKTPVRLLPLAAGAIIVGAVLVFTLARGRRAEPFHPPPGKTEAMPSPEPSPSVERVTVPLPVVPEIAAPSLEPPPSVSAARLAEAAPFDPPDPEDKEPATTSPAAGEHHKIDPSGHSLPADTKPATRGRKKRIFYTPEGIPVI